jgi:hypothetical protein
VNVAAKRGKLFLLVVRLDNVGFGNNSSHQKRFVDINFAADRISNFKEIIVTMGRKVVTESSHNLTGAKTILSLRALNATYLCLTL